MKIESVGLGDVFNVVGVAAVCAASAEDAVKKPR